MFPKTRIPVNQTHCAPRGRLAPVREEPAAGSPGGPSVDAVGYSPGGTVTVQGRLGHSPGGTAIDAVKGGAGSAVIMDGRVPHCSLVHLFGGGAVGTAVSDGAA